VIVGSMDIMAWFIPFLLFLGIATPPVAGIYIADFLLYRRGGVVAKSDRCRGGRLRATVVELPLLTRGGIA